jgi:large subunit ribosomal protein L18
MKKLEEKAKKRVRRKLRVRAKVNGTADRPRMCVFKSNRHTYVQVIDDVKGCTLTSASNLEKELNTLKNTVADAEKIGAAIGERLKTLNISTVVFDRNGFIYHGIIKAVAEGARKAGIRF